MPACMSRSLFSKAFGWPWARNSPSALWRFWMRVNGIRKYGRTAIFQLTYDAVTPSLRVNP